MQTLTPAPVFPSRIAPVINSNVSTVHELLPLPYGFAELEPIISEKALQIHYGKHYKGYVDELNKLVVGTEFAEMSLEQIMFATVNKTVHEHLYDNTAQAWNHSFFRRSLKPNGGGPTTHTLQTLINSSFDSTKTFRQELLTAATTQFGSGWVWVALERDRLKIVKTGNAGNVLTDGMTPLLVMSGSMPITWISRIAVPIT